MIVLEEVKSRNVLTSSTQYLLLGNDDTGVSFQLGFPHYALAGAVRSAEIYASMGFSDLRVVSEQKSVLTKTTESVVWKHDSSEDL